jgi:hypothetical protein
MKELETGIMVRHMEEHEDDKPFDRHGYFYVIKRKFARSTTWRRSKRNTTRQTGDVFERHGLGHTQ